MSLLSSPCTVRSPSDRFYETVLSTLSSIRTPEALKWIQYYVDSTNAQLVTPTVRDAFVVALAERDFARLWVWIREWDVDTDLRVLPRNYPHLAQVFEPEDEAEHLEDMSQERERLLIVLLDLIFKRAYEGFAFREHVQSSILTQSVTAQPSRQPLEDLAVAPFDKFEEQILTAYLLDPAMNLSPSAFDILHDLLTTRLLSHGRYSEAIDLDRRVTELVRSSQHEMSNAQLKRERRQMVDDMVSLLPRIQRDLLAAEKDLRDDMEAEESMLWASSPVERPSNTAGTAGPQGISARMEARASKRVVSLSGLVSASPRRSEQPGGNLLHAILQNQAIAARTQETNPAPSSPARRTGFEMTEHRSPKPIQQPRAQSPFSSPVKISRTLISRAHAVSSLAQPFAEMPGKAGSSKQNRVGHSSKVLASGIESAGDKTPVAVRQRSPRRRVPISSAEDVEMEEVGQTDPTELSTEVDPATGDISHQAAVDLEDITPTKTQRKRQPRYETRQKQSSVAASVDTEGPIAQVNPLESTRKPVRRSRAKQAPSMEPYVEILTPTPPRKTRKKAASVAPQDSEGAETDAVPAPKRARRTAATPSQQNTPAPLKRTARQTRSQSVMSEATTEGGDEGAQARNLRRSGRLSSVTPVSPVKKAVAAEPGVRTRRATSRQPSEAPTIPETTKPRRQTTRK